MKYYRYIIILCSAESLQESALIESNCTNFELRLDPDTPPHQNKGKLQMCFNGIWGGICNGGLRGRSAEVFCNHFGYQRRGNVITSWLFWNQLGYQNKSWLCWPCIAGLSTYSITSERNEVVLISEIYCNGNEQTISQCNTQFYTRDSSCALRHVAGLACIGKCLIRCLLLF